MLIPSNTRPTPAEIAAWIIAVVALIFILGFHLLPALLAGLLVFELVHVISPWFASHLSGQRSKIIAVGLLSFTVVSLLTLAGVGLIAFFRSDAGSLTMLFDKMAEILESSRKIFPAWLLTSLPPDAEAFKQAVTTWLRTHAAELQLAGKEAGRLAAHVAIGMIIGGMLALREVIPMDNYKPLARAMAERAGRIGLAFRRIVFAQVRIATINAIFTAIYLVIVLPLAGVHLPLTKTMIAITFLVGLIPVIGNLMSNSVIVIVSLSQSLNIAIGSLVFLILIHKLEYFLNARIVGSQIHARAWELLIAMLLMESIFGLSGVIAAPIYYAYIKDELVARGWV
ncbi:MAG: AI-2E family transporter [Sulfuriferula sp.]|nr:AI-2E family transporter [Sulfuriferula sp.]